MLVPIIVFATTAWCAGVMQFAGPGGAIVRGALTIVVALAGAAALVGFFLPRYRRRALIAYAALFGLVSIYWCTITPSNDRIWQEDVAVLPRAEIRGDQVIVHGIRDFDYRSETDWTPRYYDRTFDMSKLDRVDIVACYWMGPDIAHLFLSFGFGDEHLAISIEARKEASEAYSTLGGFFRQYELIYIAGDERDLIRLRTNYRKDPQEDVYVFRLHAPIENGRRVLREYLHAINDLHEHPQFYNTLTANCTNMIQMHSRVNEGHVPFDWRILISGHAPRAVYDAGRLDQSLPFEELMRRSLINDAAHAADQAPDFSRRIRAALPGG